MGGGRFVYVTGEMTVNLLRPRRSAAGERAVWRRWRPTLNNNLLQGCSQSAPGSHTKKHPVQRKVGRGVHRTVMGGGDRDRRVNRSGI